MSVIDLAASPSDLRALAEQSNAWPFEQAKALQGAFEQTQKYVAQAAARAGIKL